MQTVNVKDHLRAVNDQLKAAAAARGDETKAHIQAALSHAQTARAELQTKLQADRANDAANLKQTLGKLDEATAAAKKALDAQGAQVKDHLTASIGAAQAALGK